MNPSSTVEESPVDKLLKEQSTLRTPVGIFSEQHNALSSLPDPKQSYRQLLPLSKPETGEQYAFEVNIDQCSGCKACVSACHSLNGLEEHETWRDVGSIHGHDHTGSYTQTVTTACHHCIDPGCLNGCPVLAYEKDPETGIVHHLDDQCIGCQYCVMKCPYDVPKYSKKLGIVRKCDMCHSRLAEGEAPACVQSCPTEAIRITVINTDDHTTEALLPGAPVSSITKPTTRYITDRLLPVNTTAIDEQALRPEHAHAPLLIMLVFTQLSVGLFTIDALLHTSQANRYFALAFLLIGITASIFHLGRPLGVWRAFLGLRKSWLSREILSFAALAIIASAYTFSSTQLMAVGTATTIIGLFAIFTSVMIYDSTRRPFWELPYSTLRFYGTAAALGIAAHPIFGTPDPYIHYTCIAVLLIKAAVETKQLLHAKDLRFSPSKKSALLMLNPLRPITVARFSLLSLGIISILLSTHPAIPFLLILIGEIMERILFFKAVDAPKMPGDIAS